MSTSKSKAAAVSVASNTALTLGKLVIGVLSGSVSIISEAIHSGMDLLASLIAFVSVRTSDRSPDTEHPYGHEKIENLSGTIEAVLILIASGFILFESVKKLLHPGEVEHLGLGFGIMLVSAAVNFAVSKYLYSVAKKREIIGIGSRCPAPES